MAERGSGGTIPCPGCGEQHAPVYRLEGLPVLDCPSLGTPGELRMRRVPRSVHVNTFVFLRGPEHAPVEASEPVEVAAGDQPGTAEGDTTTRRRRTA